jgi:hypothetical protein
MRVYGRTTDELGNKSWFVVQTDAAGNNEYVYATALVQVLKLNLGESPFYGNYGIPAKQSIIQQIAPDFYIAFTQQQYSKYFASLIIYKLPTTFPPKPTYNVSVLTFAGTKFQVAIDNEQVPFPPAPYPVNTILPSIAGQ